MGTSLECGALLHKRYRIVEILGQGGMGSVYRAVDENLGVDVAVKENLFTTDEYARQFRLEAVILANLRHDNLPRVTDHFVIAEQGQYLIMDYIEGEDLRQRMERDSNISGDEAIQIGAAMCDALEYLHTRKPAIIHRDIKPGNVRITPDGHIYLVDFGLAKLVKVGQATTTGARAMTPGYSPPEQYGTARTDPRTDVYSLGATLYAGLSGVVPEDGLARAMDNVELTPLRKRNPIISRTLATVIEKAMAIRPEDRFQSAQEFKLGLIDSNISRLEIKGEKPVESPAQVPTNTKEDLKENNHKPEGGGNNHHPQVPSIPQKEPRGARWWVFLAAFLLTILLVTLVSVIILWSPITKSFQPTATHEISTPTIKLENTLQPTFQPLEKTKTIVPTLTATFTQTPVFTASITPTPTITYTPLPTFMGGGNNQIAYVSNRNGAPQIFIMDTDTNGPQNQLTNLPDGACQPVWSPDGLRLAFISPCMTRQDQYPEANIFIINANGSGFTKLMSEKTGDFDPAWSPDGTRIAFSSIRDGSPQIYVLNLHDNKIIALTAPSNDKHLPDWSYQPAWAPSGTQIIFTGHSLVTNALQIWSMSDAGRGQSLLIHRGDLLWNFLPEWANDGKTILFSETNGNQALGWLMQFDYENQTNDAVHMRAGTFGTHGNYSPDGSLVVFESIDLVDTNRQNYDIYLIKSDGTGPLTRLTNSLTMEFDPVWRPLVKP